MRIVGTQYSLEKKPDVVELRKSGQIVETYPYKGEVLDDLLERIWETLRRKGVTITKDMLFEYLEQMFPGVRRYGPIK